MSGEETTTVAETSVAAPEVTTADNVMSFAKALAKEHASEPEPAKETPAKQAKTESVNETVDLVALKKAYQDGDVAAIAKLLGDDPANTKITKSRWAEFRIKTREANRGLEAKRAEIEAEKSKLEAERASVSAHVDLVKRARAAADNEDYETAIELITGKKIGDVIDAMAAIAENPAARETRRLRKEVEETKLRAQQEEQQRQQAAALQAQQAAISEYKRTIETELNAHDLAAPFVKEYGAEFVNLVFAELQKHWDGSGTISTDRAARNVLRAQLAAYDRGQQHFEALRKALGQSGGTQPKTAAQPIRSGRLTPRKPTTTTQSASVTTEMTRQERNALFARQLKALHVA